MTILKKYLGDKLNHWMSISGYATERDFWQSNSPIDEGTIYDHAHAYLRSLGHVGSLQDMLNAWAQTLTTEEGTREDMLRAASSDIVGATWDVTTATIAHYRCNDNDTNTTVIDSSGNGYNGTLNNWTSSFDAVGKINGAFDIGTNCEFQVSDNVDLQGIKAMSCWFNLNSTWSTSSAARRLIQKFGSEGFILLFDAGADALMFYTSSGTGSTSCVSDSDTFTSGTWYHVYVEDDSGTTKMYIDNVLQAGTGNDSIGTTSGTDISIGHSIGAQHLDGLIDDIRLFNRILTVEERTGIYNDGNGTEGLIG